MGLPSNKKSASASYGKTKPTVAVVGCGTVGTAIGRLLVKAGYRLSGVATRSPDTAVKAAKTVGAEEFSHIPWEITTKAHVVFITTPDDAIRTTCEAIAEHGGFRKETVVIHCSGALSSEILSSARTSGALIASLHPLQSFASVDQAEKLLPGSFCTIEGDEAALPLVRKLVEDLGGLPMEITAEAKVLYHASAVTASNYLVTLIHLALELHCKAGIPSHASFEALLPLIRGTLDNIGAKGTREALTGPIARGDVDTVAGHLKAIEKEAPDLLEIYRTLGLYTVPLAEKKGTLTKEGAEKLIALLEGSNA